MKIVIPLAGKDERFDKYNNIKPLIDIHGKPLIKYCTDSFSFFKKRHEIYFILLKEQNDKYNIVNTLRSLYGQEHDLFFKILDKSTEGAASTVLSIKENINNSNPLIIYLADIYFECDLEKSFEMINADGLVPCFKSYNKKYSYLKLENPYDLTSKAIQIAEKTVISDNASAGFYYFKKGSDFVRCAESMISKNLRVNNMFYICPIYQELVNEGKVVKVIPSKFIFGLGSPEEVEKFMGVENCGSITK